MSSIYEQLQALFEDLGQGSPGATITVASLPTNVRGIVQLILRNKGTMTHQAISEAVGEFPEHRRVSQEEVDEILDALSRLDWLDMAEEAGVVSYTLR